MNLNGYLFQTVPHFDEPLKPHEVDVNYKDAPTVSENPYAGIHFDPANPDIPPIHSVIHKSETPKVKWTDFNVDKYLEAGKLREGEDRYAKNKFNQAASDATKWDRTIVDSRESGWVFFENELKKLHFYKN